MGLNENLEEIKTLLIEQQVDKKEKKFKFPFGKKVSGGQRKKNYVTALIINENNGYDFKKYQIDEQTIKHDDILRLATAGHVLDNRKLGPLVVLPNWSVEPFSPRGHYKESLVNGSNTKGYKILGAKMLSEQVGAKKSMGSIVKWILGLGLLAVIIFAFMG